MRPLPLHKLPAALRQAKTLCPQQYEGATTMCVTACSRCPMGWDAARKACRIDTGVEHFPLVDASKVPSCPIQHVCQHQTQSEAPCAVRARGFICESALVLAGVKNPWDHPLGFNATVMATAEELALNEVDHG